MTWCQHLGPFLPEYKATAECSDPSSAAVDMMPAHSSALVCPEQSTGGHGHAFAGPLWICFQFSLAISRGWKLVAREVKYWLVQKPWEVNYTTFSSQRLLMKQETKDSSSYFQCENDYTIPQDSREKQEDSYCPDSYPAWATIVFPLGSSSLTVIHKFRKASSDKTREATEKWSERRARFYYQCHGQSWLQLCLHFINKVQVQHVGQIPVFTQ